MSFGENVRRLRNEMGWTLAQLAERSGLHPVALSRLETGGRPDPRLSTACALADALGVQVDDLREKNPEKTNQTVDMD